MQRFTTAYIVACSATPSGKAFSSILKAGECCTDLLLLYYFTTAPIVACSATPSGKASSSNLKAGECSPAVVFFCRKKLEKKIKAVVK